MASLFSRIGKPAPNFTSAGNPAGQLRSNQGGMGAAQGLRKPDPNYQPPPAVQQAQQRRLEYLKNNPHQSGGGTRMTGGPPAGMNAFGFNPQTGQREWKNIDPSTMDQSGLMNSSSGYQAPGLQQGGGATPLARPPQAPPNLGGMQGGQQSPMGGGIPYGGTEGQGPYTGTPLTASQKQQGGIAANKRWDEIMRRHRSLPTGSRLYAPGAMEEQRRKNDEMRKNKTGPFAPGYKSTGRPL